MSSYLTDTSGLPFHVPDYRNWPRTSLIDEYGTLRAKTSAAQAELRRRLDSDCAQLIEPDTATLVRILDQLFQNDLGRLNDSDLALVYAMATELRQTAWRFMTERHLTEDALTTETSHAAA